MIFPYVIPVRKTGLAQALLAAIGARLPGYAAVTPDTLQRRFLQTPGEISTDGPTPPSSAKPNSPPPPQCPGGTTGLCATSSSEPCVEPVAWKSALGVHVAAEILGVPKQDRHWLASAARASTAEYEGQDARLLTAAHDAAGRIRDYFASLILERQRAPRDDLVSIFAADRRTRAAGSAEKDVIAILWGSPVCRRDVHRPEPGHAGPQRHGLPPVVR